MPSFPTGVFSPTSKSAGQVIQPAHINDLQDEVVAIESGYLNGTAPLNSSNSTVVSLRVASTASFASSVTFEGNVTIAGTLTAASAATNVVALTGSTTPLANGSTTPLTWPTQVIALNSSVHSTATNAERLTPQSTGVYEITASIMLNAVFTNGSTASLQLILEDSSGGTLGATRVGAAGQTNVTASVSGMKRFDTLSGSTQWVRLVAEQRSGSTHSLLGTFSFCQFKKING